MHSRELLIADTSFVGNHRRVVTRPELATIWSHEIIQRIETAVIAISVVTIAKEQLGHRLAGWGERRRVQASGGSHSSCISR